MHTLGIIEGCEITVQDDGSVTWTAPAMVDGDGTGGNAYHDPDFQNQTTLRQNGVSLNAERIRFIVVPPQVVQGVPGIVMGCQGFVFNHNTGKEADGVVADQGPDDKIGEYSVAMCQAIEVPSNPVSGGDARPRISCRITPGVAAVVDGQKYTLQKST